MLPIVHCIYISSVSVQESALKYALQSYRVGEKGIDALTTVDFQELDDIAAADSTIHAWRFVQVKGTFAAKAAHNGLEHLLLSEF